MQSLVTKQEHLELLSKMILIRESELVIGRGYFNRQFKTPIHLGIGQEAVAVGVAQNLTKSDFVLGNHRSHAHYLSKGASSLQLFLEILGKRDGCSGGHGGSMHISAPDHGVIGTMPIVAGTIPIAAGAALTLKRRKNGHLAVAYFGDGAVEEGVFHEAMNLASIMKLPILFVCENNIYSSHLHITERQPSAAITRFAQANMINNATCDGNDLREVLETSKALIEKIRLSSQPAFLEAKTYRLYGHVGFDKDENIGLDRQHELPKWEARDPIYKYSEFLTEGGFTNPQEISSLRAKILETLEAEWLEALNSQPPKSSTLLENVYFEGAK